MSSVAGTLFSGFLMIATVVLIVIVWKRFQVQRRRYRTRMMVFPPDGAVGRGSSSHSRGGGRVAPDDSSGATPGTPTSPPRGDDARIARLNHRIQQLQIVEMQLMADEERALQHAVEASMSHRSGPTSPEDEEARTGGSGTAAEQQALQAALEQSVVSSVRALPTKPFSEMASPSGGQEEEECSMCMETFEGSDEVRILACKHYFHTDCIVSRRRNPNSASAPPRGFPLCMHFGLSRAVCPAPSGQMAHRRPT